jgi:Heavy metal binding domain
MNASRPRFLGCPVGGSPRHFALALGGMATLLLGGVSCSKAPEPERKVKMYQSPMHPWITSEKPGNCTICGMVLVPVYEGESGMEVDPGIVALNPRSVDVLAVTTVPVRRLDLTKSLRFSGILEDDENLHRIIAAFYDGRIDEIYVEHVGQQVEKGQPLARSIAQSCFTLFENIKTRPEAGIRRWQEIPRSALFSMGSARSRWQR